MFCGAVYIKASAARAIYGEKYKYTLNAVSRGSGEETSVYKYTIHILQMLSLVASGWC